MRATSRSAAIAAIAVLGTSGIAAAADLPVLAPPPLLTWTGFYAGLNAGVGWGTSHASTTGSSLFDGQAAFTAAGAVNPTSSFVPGNTASASNGSSRANAFGFLAGGQIGFNYQPVGSRMVLGIEADLQGADISGHGTSVGHATDTFAAQSLTFNKSVQSANYAEALSVAWGNPSFTRTATGTDRVSTRVGWLGTVRGRVGYLVTPDLLLYATGGLAYGGASASGDYGLDVNYRLSADSFALGYVQASGPSAFASTVATATTGSAIVTTNGSTAGNGYTTSITSSNTVTTNGGAVLGSNVIATPTLDPSTGTSSNVHQTFGTTSSAVYTATAPGQGTTTFTHATIVPSTVTGTTTSQGSSARYSQTRLGITIGGGAEWRFLPNWSLKGEALYYNLGSETIVGPALTSAPNIVTAMLPVPPVLDAGTAQKIVNFGGTQNVTNRTVTKVRFDGVLLRAGVNYHF